MYIYIYIYEHIYIYIYIYIYICICIYVYSNANLPANAIVRLPNLGSEIAKARRHFKHPLLTSQLTTMTESAQTTIPLYQHYGQRD